MEPAFEMVAEHREDIGIRRRGTEDCQPGNMHRRFRCFAVQKARIES